MEDISFRGVECPKEEANNMCWGVRETKGELTEVYFKISPPEADELRIKVHHVGLCHTDVSFIENEWGMPSYLPMIPGHEMVGIVSERGAKCSKYPVGTRVGFGPMRDCCGDCKMCRSGEDGLCREAEAPTWTYNPHLGGYSTIFQGKEKYFFYIPEGIPFHRAPPLLCAGVTVFVPLQRYAKPGMRVGVVGIGGLGHLAILFAVKMGMEVYALSSSSGKEEVTRELGAHQFLLSTDHQGIQTLQQEGGLHLIINTSYALDITPYMDCVGSDCTLIQVGAPPGTTMQLPKFWDILDNQKKLIGYGGMSRTDTQNTLDFAAQNSVFPVTENYKWSEFPKAYAKLHDGKPIFRCVVDVADTL